MKYLSLLLLLSTFANAQTYTGGLPLPGLPKSVGPKPMAGSTSVTIATDQPPISVSFSAASAQLVNQGLPTLTASAWPVKPTDGVNSQLFTPAGQAKVYVEGGSVTITGSPSITALQGTSPWAINGTVAVTNTATVQIAPNANASQSTVSVTAVESSIVAPANAVGVILEAESGNATNIRWGASNSAANILSSSVGLLQEPGRDSGYVPLGVGTYLHLISVAAGTNNAGIQWVLSQ